jgi:predicted enzyme related to lactoylglutathione lyase
VLRSYLHVRTQDFEGSVRLLMAVTNDDRPPVVQAGPVQVALVGGFMVLGGPKEVLDGIPDSAGSVVVDDLDRTESTLRAEGAEIITPAGPSPLGRFLYARHPDGTVVEYNQFDDALLEGARPQGAGDRLGEA